ncbi:hypothetical protein [Limnofasciculus baicalensis]|uniref:Uncharacterized protein n=1 Tax=Limnofasciculus baicalensis BBK-W-15 TaxID=2699891 RepID=A0AAE3KKJ6_9CYAN|nr:hypothetical protein [Limnofasciculus baicalensis]MCP2727620.1 hypothetical protein [Limnofasciculus baicalensis BBK-W-15]
MSDNNDWEQICDKVQHRLRETTPLTVQKAKVLRAEFLKYLTNAHNEGILTNKIHEIHNLLKLDRAAEYGKEIFEIIGGQRNFKRSKDIPHFERFDKCWFDFAILVDETQKPAEIIGFNFEMRFPEESSVRFIRFDLNLPNHDNEARNLRFHFHPGSDDFMIHSPPMSPLEILHLFLYGLSIPGKHRSP